MTSGRVPRLLLLGALALIVIMWIYVLFVGNPENVDKLHDAAYGQSAEPICHATVDTLTRIGVVNQVATTPQQRADLADRADNELRAMVSQLKAVPVRNADDAQAVGKWLAAWDQFLVDRDAWVAQLRAGQNVQFLEKQLSDGRPNSKPLNDFAQVNGMRSCATPGGV